MNHNDASSDGPPIDPDATEVVETDLEAMLHLALDLEKKSQSQQPARPKAAPGAIMSSALPLRTSTRLPVVTAPRPSTRLPVTTPPRPSSRFPVSRSAIPRMPIHTLPPPAPEEDDEDPTSFYDRRRASVPSVKSVSFRASDFSIPLSPRPFNIAAPASSNNAGESMGITPIQTVLPPTSRRELMQPASAHESLAPMSMGGSMYPSYPPPRALKKSIASTLSLVLTLAFALASVALMGMAVLMPSAIDRGKTTLFGKKSIPATPAAQKPAATAPATIAVPPVLFEEGVIEEVGEHEAYVIFPESSRGHRLFIDGRVVGEGNERGMLVECGKHKVQLGSNGTPRMLDLPCGGGWRLSE